MGLARLASERATRPAVKKFGEMILRDYRQASEELRQIASTQQVNAGAENEQLKVERERLSRLSGEQFDREYLDEIIADYQDALGDLENAAKGNNPKSPSGRQGIFPSCAGTSTRRSSCVRRRRRRATLLSSSTDPVGPSRQIAREHREPSKFGNARLVYQ